MKTQVKKINPVMKMFYRLMGHVGYKYETDSAAYCYSPISKSVILFEKYSDSVWYYTEGHPRYAYLSDYVKRGSKGEVRKYTKKQWI